jgi:hypothetical protein
MGGKTWYSPEFEQFWRAYEAPPNASKQKAYEAYKKARDLPNLPLLLQCVYAYKEYVAASSRKDFVVSICHPATWLNQGRYEGFLDMAEKHLVEKASVTQSAEASVAASTKSWPDDVLKALCLDEPILKAWFLPCTLVMSSPAEIITPTKMHENWLKERHQDRIERVLGEGVVIHKG